MSDASSGARGPAGSRAKGGLALSRATLDLVPAAVAVSDGTRAIVASNHRFEAAFGAHTARTCCELVGCRDPAGPTSGACVTEIVLAGHAPWSGEVRPWGTDPPVQLLATEMHGLVVLSFEPAPADPPQPERADQPLQVHCLGSLRVGAEEGEPQGWLEQRPGMLLKYLLAMRHRPVRTDEIVESLWPGSVTAGPGTVRYIVHQLRRRLEPVAPEGDAARFILRTVRGYQLDLDAVWVDADAYEAAVRTAVAAALRADAQGSEAAGVRAVNLYRGEFLRDDPYEEWALAERDRLHAMLETPLRMLVEANLAAGDLEGAADYAERLARHEPLDADVQRLVLGLWLRQGRRSRALRHYELFRARMWRAFGEAPPFSLADLAEEL